MRRSLLLLALVSMSCGGRSGLDEPGPRGAWPGPQDAGPPDAGPRDAGADAGFDGGAPIPLCTGSLMGGVAGSSPFGELDMRVEELRMADCCTLLGRAGVPFVGAAGDRLELPFLYDATCEGGERRVLTEGVVSETMEATYTEPNGTPHVVFVRADWEIGELREVRPLGPHVASVRAHIGNDEWDATVVFGGGFCDWLELLC